MGVKLDDLPPLGSALDSYESGHTSALHAIVLFMETWNRMERQKGMWHQFYRAMQIIPHVEWSPEPFRWWANAWTTVDSFEMFHETYLSQYGPLFDAVEFVREYERNPKKAVKGLRQQQKERTIKKVEELVRLNPDATHEQVAEWAGVSRVRVTQIVNEMKTKDDANPLKDKDNFSGDGDFITIDSKRRGHGSTGKAYILGRLKRDAVTDPKAKELLAQVEKGEISARKAGIEAGFIKPADPARIVEKKVQELTDTEVIDLFKNLHRSLPESFGHLEMAKESARSLTDEEMDEFVAWLEEERAARSSL